MTADNNPRSYEPGVNGAVNAPPENLTTPWPISPPKSALLPQNTSDIVTSNYVHEPRAEPVRIIFIGTGISGIAFAYKANKLPYVSYTIYEKNSDVGGVWLEHSYPGVACDVPAHGYSYTWRPNPDWSRFYARGEEIREWYAGLAWEYGVYERTKFRHRVEGAVWSEDEQLWTVLVRDLETGEVKTDKAEILINGGGSLNNWKWPDIQGLHDFKGELFHTAAWDNKASLEHKRVAVIGSGASGIQVVPAILPQVSQLISFNRSPTWVAPDFAWQLAPEGRETRYSEEQRRKWRENPDSLREYRRSIEHAMNIRFPGFYKHSDAQYQGRKLVAEAMAKRLNHDPELCEKLIPKFELGCRRVTPGHGYLEALTSPKASVITSGIKQIVADGIIDNDGTFHPVDVIITATGYETSFVPRFPIIGLNNTNLQDVWRENGASTYLSVAVAGFPNYFMTLGPNSPISNGSLVAAMERQLDYALRFAERIARTGVTSAVVTTGAEAEFREWKDEIMKGLAWSGSCTSWYKNGTADGPVIGPWPGSVNHFLEIMREPRYEDFDIKYRSRNRFTYFGDGRAPVEARGEQLGWYMQ